MVRAQTGARKEALPNGNPLHFIDWYAFGPASASMIDGQTLQPRALICAGEMSTMGPTTARTR